MADQLEPFEVYDRPATIVETQVAEMTQRADETLERANAAIAALADVAVGYDFGAPPNPILPDINIGSRSRPTQPDTGLLGQVDDYTVPAFSLLDAEAGFTFEDAPEFDPSIGPFSIPDAPAPIDASGAPVRPELRDVALPTAPDITEPSIDTLAQIEIPSFTFPELPTFEDEEPEFTGATPTTQIQWQESAYSSTLLDTTRDRVMQMLSGGTGLPQAIERALFDRARGREDLTAARAIDQVTADWAARGWDRPQGAQAAQIDAVREQNQLQANALAREILINSAQWEIENLRFAVAQGIAIEQVLIGLWNSMAERALQVARFKVEADIQLFNSLVALFNARQQSRQIAVQVFQAKLQAELAKLDEFRLRIEAEKAKADLNESLVRVYQARVQAIGQRVEVFKTLMEGQRIQSDIERNRIEAYKVDVDAWAETVRARLAEYQGYAERIRGELAKAQVLEAESRAFAATVQAQESNNNTKIARMGSRVQALQASVTKFQALLSAERERIAGQLGAIQARAQSFSADVSRYTADQNAETSERELRFRIIEDRLRNTLALFDTVNRRWESSMTRLQEQSRIKVSQLSAAGQYTSQLAAGAMAALNISASLSGNGSASTTSSYSTSHVYNHDTEG